MSANLESGVFSNTPAWHREGVVLDSNGEKGIRVEEALPASGLDWSVSKIPVFGFSPEDLNQKTGAPKSGAKPIEIEGRYGVQRDTDNKILGVVGKTWQPVQNTEGFQLINDVLDAAGGEVWIEAAGALDGGKKVWVLAHVDDNTQIAGEDYQRYIGFTNGHDGRTSVTAFTTDVRVVCQNTLEMALSTAPRAVRVRHTKKATERIKEAHAVLNLRNLRSEELAKQGEWLVEQSMSDDEFMGFLDKLMPLPEDGQESPARTMISDRRSDVANLWLNAENLKPIKGTKWCAYQAVVEWADHYRSVKSDASRLKSQFGLTPVPVKEEAHRLLSL